LHAGSSQARAGNPGGSHAGSAPIRHTLKYFNEYERYLLPTIINVYATSSAGHYPAHGGCSQVLQARKQDYHEGRP